MNNKLKYFIYSQNSINTYKSCPKKFKYKYIDKINWKYDDIESREYYDSLKVGSEFHLLCERYFSNIPLGLNEYTNPKFKVWIDKIKNMFPMNKKNNKIYLPEYEVRFNLDGNIITAKYDLIIIDENSIEVWDWKTENVKLEYIKVKDRIQTVVYMFLAKEAVCKIFNLNIDYNNIKMKYYQPQYDDIPIEIIYNERQHELNKSNIIRYIDMINNTNYEKNDNYKYELIKNDKYCSFCEFNKLCNRQDVVYSMLEEDIYEC